MQHPKQPVLGNCQTDSMNTGLTCGHSNTEKLNRYERNMGEYNKAKDKVFNACMNEKGYTTAIDNQCP
ncbi:MAG: hypothetical protein GY781_06630 [Gammaproteobacteria bacterium]|nr:hypothetical protein [Gammaproteobacteria bacterium]